MDEAALIAIVQREIGTLTSSFVADNYADSVDNAERDCGWVLPQTTAFKLKWLKARTKRHLFEVLCVQSAPKYRYKQSYRQQEFDHWTKLIMQMDEAFMAVQEEYPHEFADVPTYEMFGHRISSGFVTEPQTGRDLTYDSDNVVMIHPNDDS